MKTKLSALCVLVLCAGSLLFGRNPERPIHLFLAGDSTMANKAPAPENPERGWGEALPYFFNGTVTIDNRALNGRSTLSFRSEGHWEDLLGDLEEGDWVLIQFGHNDQKSQDPTRFAAARTEYRETLIRFIREARRLFSHVVDFRDRFFLAR